MCGSWRRPCLGRCTWCSSVGWTGRLCKVRVREGDGAWRDHQSTIHPSSSGLEFACGRAFACARVWLGVHVHACVFIRVLRCCLPLFEVHHPCMAVGLAVAPGLQAQLGCGCFCVASLFLERFFCHHGSLPRGSGHHLAPAPVLPHPTTLFLGPTKISWDYP